MIVVHSVPNVSALWVLAAVWIGQQVQLCDVFPIVTLIFRSLTSLNAVKRLTRVFDLGPVTALSDGHYIKDLKNPINTRTQRPPDVMCTSIGLPTP